MDEGAAPAELPEAAERARSGRPADARWQSHRCRSLLRADDLAQLNPAGLKALHDYGVGTVLDLRWPQEAGAAPEPGAARACRSVRYERVSLLTHTEDEWRLRSRDFTKELWKCVVLEHARLELQQVLSFDRRRRAGPAAVSLRRRQGPHRPDRRACAGTGGRHARGDRLRLRPEQENLRASYLETLRRGRSGAHSGGHCAARKTARTTC